MKRKLLTFISFAFIAISNGQRISIANDKMNIFYVGVDNPISFAAEGIPKNSLVIKSPNGIISKEYGYYTFRSDSVGKADIILYKKNNGKLIEIGRQSFRVKKIPDPVFKIGSGYDSMPVVAFKNQDYVRAELENFDIDNHTPIISFKTVLISQDTCKYTVITNIGSKIGDSLKHEFQLLKKGDIVIFKEILIQGLYGQQFIKPRTFFLY